MFSRPDPYLATSRRADIAVHSLTLDVPKPMDGRTALFVSDIHLRAGMDAERFADLLARQEADLILLGGDYADTREEALRLFRALRVLRAPMGIFAVCGNNDAEAFPSHDALADALSLFGARLLVNQSARIGDGLWIGGADEPRYGHPDFARIFPDASAADYRILLSHYPLRAALDTARPNLMLSGHTHGGQFNFLGVTPYTIGFERLGRKGLAPALVCGARQFGPATLLVSKGVGCSRIPLRVGVRPEIHKITFRAKNVN